MNCPHCANETPDGSKYCNHCGLSPDAKPKATHGGTMFLAGLLLAGAIAGIFYAVQPRTANSKTIPASPGLVQRNQPVVATAFTVKSGGWTSYAFQVPAGADKR